MKRIRRASRQVYLSESFAGNSKQTTEQQRAKQLNQSKLERQRVEQEYDRFFELSSDIFSIVGFDGYFKRLNPVCERILGFSQTELLLTPFLEFVHPDDRAATIAVVQKLAVGERIDHFENRYRCREGSYKWLSWSGIGVVEEELIYCTARDITEQKQIEEARQQSKQYYESLIHSLNGIIWEFDLQVQKFLFVSHKAEEILGYPVEQWLTEPHFWENHIHSEDRERAVKSCHQFVLNKQEGQLEYRMVAADGKIVWIQDIITLVIEAGEPIKLRGVLIDVTQSQQAKEALYRREQEFRALVENSPDVILRVDRDCRYLYANPKIEERGGFSATEYIGKTSQELGFSEDLVALWHGAVQRVVETRQEQWIEFEFDSPSGHIFNHSRLVPEFAADGSVETVLVVIRDITEHKQVEIALQESEARFRAFMQHSPCLAWIAGIDGTLLYANPTFLQGLQFLTKATVLGKSLFDIFPPGQAQQFFENNNRVLQSNQVLETVESAVHLNGTTGEFLVYKFPLPTASGQQAVAGMAVDITELKRTEAALRESEERFRQIAESIHEVFWIADIDFTQLLYVSPAYEEIWGRTCQSLYEQPKSFLEAVYPEDKSRVIAMLKQHRQTGFSHEYRIVQPDGNIRWIWERAFTVNDLAGNPYRVVGISQDITDRKLAEEALGLADFSFDRSALAAVWIGNDARILRVNEGSCQMLGYSREELQSKYVYDLDPNFPRELWAEHWQQLRQQKTLTFTSQLQRKDGSLIPIETTLNYLQFNGKEYNFAFARNISERLQAEAALQQQAEREKLLGVIAQRIRQTLDPTDVLSTTVTEVRQLLQADRTIIFRFNPDWSGVVTVESVKSPWRSILGEFVYDRCFVESYIQPYQQGRVSAIDDVLTAGLNQCHINLLTQFQVRANIVVPILQGNHLWGLLIVHQCSSSRRWQTYEVDLLQQLSTHVAIALQQSELYQQAQAEIVQRQLAEAALRQQSEHEQLIADITNRMRRSLDLDDVLSVMVNEVRHVLDADRVLVFQLHSDGSGSIVKEAVLPEYPITKEMRWLDECFPLECYEFYRQGKVRIVPDIATDDWGACLVEFMQSVGVKSKVVAPIVQTIDGPNTTRVWGLLIAHACAEQRQWQPIEADLLQHLSSKLVIAIQQAELHQKVQQLNASLEIQVKERTLELQQALEFEALLKRITDKVRDSLDENQILQTAVRELATGLNVQCCDAALYDFDQENSTVKYEYIAPGVSPAIGKTFLFSNLPEVYDQLLQGQYVYFSTTAIPNFWREGIVPQFTILSCSLMDDQGVLGDLWLFRPCENCFSDLEIRLIKQVANQCAIALRQSRLYQAAQVQVTELERLNQLKDDFLSTVSHELRTPMSNIKMALQMLEVSLPVADIADSELDRISRYFNILRDECQRETSLINDLLELTQLDAEIEPLNLTTIDLQIWIPHVLEPFEQRIHNQQQQLHISIPTTLPAITTDLSYLERILTELVNNACKYTPTGEQIAISADTIPGKESNRSTAPASLVIMVCNSGVEISDSELEHIFDRFYRVPNNDPWKHGGTGLGLALVKQLVKKLNGTIEVSSHHLQTTFTIQLPLVD